jgi:hypothetical protein
MLICAESQVNFLNDKLNKRAQSDSQPIMISHWQSNKHAELAADWSLCVYVTPATKRQHCIPQQNITFWRSLVIGPAQELRYDASLPSSLIFGYLPHFAHSD